MKTPRRLILKTGGIKEKKKRKKKERKGRRKKETQEMNPCSGIFHGKEFKEMY